jgi:hypothetical protein
MNQRSNHNASGKRGQTKSIPYPKDILRNILSHCGYNMTGRNNLPIFLFQSHPADSGWDFSFLLQNPNGGLAGIEIKLPIFDIPWKITDAISIKQIV